MNVRTIDPDCGPETDYWEGVDSPISTRCNWSDEPVSPAQSPRAFFVFISNPVSAPQTALINSQVQNSFTNLGALTLQSEWSEYYPEYWHVPGCTKMYCMMEPSIRRNRITSNLSEGRPTDQQELSQSDGFLICSMYWKVGSRQVLNNLTWSIKKCSVFDVPTHGLCLSWFGITDSLSQAEYCNMNGFNTREKLITVQRGQ